MKLNILNDWNLIDVDNISGRLNVMWLTSEGVGISTRDYSHMTILNMICEKSDVHDFWNIEEIKKHNVDDVIQLNDKYGTFKNNNLKLVEYMSNFMKKTKFVRVSGPYRNVEFGGSKYGHAAKLLENRRLVYEYYNKMTDKQSEFINKVINTYSLQKEEVQEEIYYD